MSNPTSAGWFEDPEDATRLRYFDGIVWTAHTTPLTSPTAASSTIGRAPDVTAASERTEPAPGRDWSAPPAWNTVGSAPTGGVLPDGAVLAEWWRRLLARVLDWIVVAIVGGLLSIPFVGPLVTAFQDYFRAALAGQTPDEAAFQSAVTEVALPITLISLAVGLLYETSFLLWRGATPGKMVLGTVVRPAAAAGPVTLGVALRRQAIDVLTSGLGLMPVVALLGSALSVLDPAWLLWDPRRQCLHDKVADTVVVLRR